MATRIRGFVFTLNNYTEEEYAALLAVAHSQAKYYIFGKEHAPTTGTPHIQGYIYWKNGKTIEASRKLLPRRVSNHEPALGSPDQNYIYCSKEAFETNMPAPKQKNKCCKKQAISCLWTEPKCGCVCHCDSCRLKKQGFKSWEELREWERNEHKEMKRFIQEQIDKYGDEWDEQGYETEED